MALVAQSMQPHAVPGTQGYGARAARIIPHWQRICFAESHAAILHLLPPAPARIVDIGAGIGMDAAALSARGHSVLAVEPTAELRQAGMALHASLRIEWLDDHLPLLTTLLARAEDFDAIMLNAVWMHLDEPERIAAMPRIARLLRPGAKLFLSLRHGPVPQDRRMFDVSAEETLALACAHRLRPILNRRTDSVQAANRCAGVTWTRLVFAAPD